MCFGSPSIPILQPQPKPPKESDPEVQAAMEKEKELARLRRGRASTILTSFTGLDDTGKKKTLLGS